MKKIIGFFIIILLIGAGLPAYGIVNINERNFRTLPMSPGNHFKFMFFDGEICSYRVHIPPSYDGTTPMPIVFVFHGCPGGAIPIMLDTGLNTKADEEGFIAVYPNGHIYMPYLLYSMKYLGISFWLGCFRYWNFWDFVETDVDDVGFFQTLVGELQTTLNINSSRIYVTGYSGGASMSYRLGAELSDIIAAIAPVAGAIGGRFWIDESTDPRDVPFYMIPEPEYPLHVIIFHGMHDIYVPYEGEKFSWGGVFYTSVNESIDFWVEHNNCDPIPQIDISQSKNIITRTYSNGNLGTEVVLYTVVEGGHEWFGGPTPASPPCEISANDLIWEFLESHPKQ